jgi:PadR family transcriptional regulator PadR
VPDGMLREFFLGFIRIHILHSAAQHPLFGLALIEDLHRRGHELSAGTLYPILHALESAGYLAHENRLVEGKVRRYYTTTENGERALCEARRCVQELVEELLDVRGATRQATDNRLR